MKAIVAVVSVAAPARAVATAAPVLVRTSDALPRPFPPQPVLPPLMQPSTPTPIRPVAQDAAPSPAAAAVSPAATSAAAAVRPRLASLSSPADVSGGTLPSTVATQLPGARQGPLGGAITPIGGATPAPSAEPLPWVWIVLVGGLVALMFLGRVR